uniref:HSF-type DNA-binding domain-containing protein n=1 Tax=Takifugu rubripes TaxID=31033 RepID=A0A674MWB0_TAKRU
MKRSEVNPNTFPAKLWFLVNTPEITAIIWNNVGNGILIDKALLETQVLSPTSDTLRGLRKFKGIKFLSFIRQLHHYGFKKVKPVRVTSNCVHHFFQPYFKKDHPELLPEVKRKVRQRTRSRPAPYSNPYNMTGMQYVVQQPHGEHRNSKSANICVFSAGIFHYLPAQPFPNNMEYFLTGANPSLYPRTAPNTYNLQTLVQPIETGHQKVIEDPFNDLNEMLSLLSTLKEQAQVNFTFTP